MAEIYKTAFFKDKYLPIDQANLNIASSPVIYGLSTYTVLPVFLSSNKKQLNIFRLMDHYKRLQNSAKILNFNDFIDEWDYDSFKQVIINVLKTNNIQEDCLVRVTVFVDAVMGGIRMIGLPHKMAVFAYPMTEVHHKNGIKLGVSSWRRNPDNAIPARAKISGGYVNSALMKNEAVNNGFDDAVALDDQGHVTESTVSNIFIIKDNKLITPSTSSDLLEGLTRDSIFAFAKELKIEVKERMLDRTELYLAEEVFLCGSSMSIIPVGSIDQRIIGNGKPGKITKQLDKAYENLVHGLSKDQGAWLTAVSF
jgi:branched-chain amino acid aminotransferase